MEEEQKAGSSSGLDPKLGALLSYLLGIIGGIIFLVIEKENKYVRFHAAQSITVSVAAIAIGIGLLIVIGILAAIPGINVLAGLLFLLVPLYYLGVFVLFIVLLIKAWTDYDEGKIFKLPVLGGIAEKIAGQA